MARNPDSLPKDDTIQGYKLDLSKHEDVVELAATLSSKTIDVIIHNAGFNPKDNKSMEGYFDSTFYCNEGFSAANVAESMMINALHPMELTGKLLKSLSEDAVIITVSSWLESIGGKTLQGHYGYTGSKSLMNMCMKGLSLEFEKDKNAERTAIALNPGWMQTDMGGKNADITPEEVSTRVLAMIDDGYFKSKNGCFLNTDRTEHQW